MSEYRLTDEPRRMRKAQYVYCHKHGDYHAMEEDPYSTMDPDDECGPQFWTQLYTCCGPEEAMGI